MHNSIYLRVEDVTGEAKDGGHKEWIDVQHFQWQLRQPTENGVGGGGGSGRLMVRDLEVFARLDKAMPTMMTLGARGSRLKTVTVALSKAGSGQKDYLNITLKNVILSGVEMMKYTGGGGMEGNAVAAGAMGVVYRFSPSLVEVNYYEQNEDGEPGAPVTFNWDVKGNVQ